MGCRLNGELKNLGGQHWEGRSGTDTGIVSSCKGLLLLQEHLDVIRKDLLSSGRECAGMGISTGRWRAIGRMWATLGLPCECTCLGYLKTISLGNLFVLSSRAAKSYINVNKLWLNRETTPFFRHRRISGFVKKKKKN